MGNKRIDRSQTTPPANDRSASPFAALAGLREQLPAGDVPAAPSPAPPEGAAATQAKKVVVRRERAGRGGKTVTVVEQLGLDAPALTAMAKRMKKALGCGATVEGEALVLLGDLEERAAAWLEKEGVAKTVMMATKR